MKSNLRVENHDFIPTRLSLLSRLKDWDNKESWKQFFDIYWKLIYRTAVKAGLTDQEAQDVVQETVIAVAKQMGKFKYDPALGSFKGWLHQVTRGRIGDHWRKRRRDLPLANLPAADTSRTPTIERVPDSESLNLDWEEEWQKNLVDAAMERAKRKVGAKQYQVFDLYVAKGWKVPDVCRILGVSAFQVYQARTRVSRAIKKEIEYLKHKMI